MTENKPENTEHKPDRVGEYLVRHLDDMIFDELSDSYLKKAEIGDFMKGVPVPFKADQMASGSASTLMLASNMAYVVGCDGSFKYKDAYLKYIKKFFPHDFDKPLLNEGVKAAKAEDPETACIYFRAALLVDPDSQDALFLYARALKDAYEAGDGEDYVGTFKGESIRRFEEVTVRFPDFDQGYYFLGYGYLNLGLYLKAKLTFDEFVRLTDNAEMKAEAQSVLEQLKDPCRIEEGMNDIQAGRTDKGMEILLPYRNDERFNTYWPLWYYLGLGSRDAGDTENAEKMILTALKYSPSNIELMDELVSIYHETGETEKADKYLNKIDIVRHNEQLDIEEKAKDSGGLS